MTYDINTLLDHPNRNPAHDPNFPGRRAWVKTGIDCNGNDMTTRMIVRDRNPSRWMPHNGVSECERRDLGLETGSPPCRSARIEVPVLPPTRQQKRSEARRPDQIPRTRQCKRGIRTTVWNSDESKTYAGLGRLAVARRKAHKAVEATMAA